MQTLAPSETADYTAEPCPYCGERSLYLEFDEWLLPDGTPTEEGTHAHCKNESEDGPDHYDMPYVYWLPVDKRAHAWAVKNICIAEKDDRKELDAWNQGKPL